MELGMSCSFQILNTRTQYGPKKLQVFYEYFNYRPRPEKNRSKSEPEISNYVLGLNVWDPKDPRPERNRSGPDPKS